MLVFTAQAQGFDITKPHKPLPDYTEPGGKYYAVSRFLKWDSWAWGFQKMFDFFITGTDERIDSFYYKVEYIDGRLDWVYRMSDNPNRRALWILDIPNVSYKLRWTSIVDSVKKKHANQWLWTKPEKIRRHKDIPIAAIKLPVPPESVMAIVSKPDELITITGESFPGEDYTYRGERLLPDVSSPLMEFESAFNTTSPEDLLAAISQVGKVFPKG